MNNLQWILAISRSNFEYKAVELLKKKIIDKEKSELFGEIIIPESETKQQSNGKTKTVKKKLFPGYILIQVVPSIDMVAFIKSSTYISSVMCDAQMNPQILSEEDVNKMRQIKETTTSHDYKVGDEVKILSGPFANFNGTIDKIEKSKIIVNVSIFGRPTPVELHPSDLQ